MKLIETHAPLKEMFQKQRLHLYYIISWNLAKTSIRIIRDMLSQVQQQTNKLKVKKKVKSYLLILVTASDSLWNTHTDWVRPGPGLDLVLG